MDTAAGWTVFNNAESHVSWLPLLSGSRVRLPYTWDFGVSAQTLSNMFTSLTSRTPAAGGLAVSVQDAALNPANIVVVLAGTNTATLDATAQNLLLSALDYWSNPANCYNNEAKTIILCNELPRGRDWTGTLANPHSVQAGLYAWSRWLLTLDYRVPTTGMARVIAVNTYDAFADYTTIPDATAGRPVGKPAFGGGSTANANTFLPNTGLLADGLHFASTGSHLAAQTIVDEALAAICTAAGFTDDVTARLPTSATGWVNDNPMMTGTTGSWTGSANYVESGALPDGWTIGVSGAAGTINIDATAITNGIRFTLSWSGVGNSQPLFSFYQQMTSAAALVRNFAAGDRGMVYGKVKVAAGSSRLNGAGLFALVFGDVADHNMSIQAMCMKVDSPTASPPVRYGMAFGAYDAAFDSVIESLPVDTSYITGAGGSFAVTALRIGAQMQLSGDAGSAVIDFTSIGMIEQASP